MRYTFLIVFGLMFLGLNAVQAQSCCSKAKASTAAVEQKNDAVSKVTTVKVTGDCSESASTSQTASATRTADVTKACDPSTCSKTSCDLSKCDPAKCDPTKCPKLGAMKASNTADKSKKTKATSAL